MAPLLLRYFLRRVERPEDAADLLSETLIVAWRRIGTVPDEPDQERAWMYTVAGNVLSNERRSRLRRSKLVDALRSEIRVPDVLETADLAFDVERAIDKLPPPEPELVRLVHWEGLSASEAGRVLGIPESTARARYAAAREALRESLEDLVR